MGLPHDVYVVYKPWHVIPDLGSFTPGTMTYFGLEPSGGKHIGVVGGVVWGEKKGKMKTLRKNWWPLRENPAVMGWEVVSNSGQVRCEHCAEELISDGKLTTRLEQRSSSSFFPYKTHGIFSTLFPIGLQITVLPVSCI